MNKKYGLEFDNLLSQNFPQDFIRPNIGNRNFQQINSNEFDFGQFDALVRHNPSRLEKDDEVLIVNLKEFIKLMYDEGFFN